MKMLTRRLQVIGSHLQASRISHFTTLIDVQPRVSLVDEKVKIHIRGLKPHQTVTLVADLTENNVDFVSSGVFQANSAGEVDVSNQDSLAGTYTGRDAMGLFWSIIPQNKSLRSTIRLVKKDVAVPMKWTLQLFDGRFNVSEDHMRPCGVLAETNIEKYYMKKGVKRIPVTEGDFRGTIFIPEGDGPFPGLLDMFGGFVSIVETRAALLASHGFATFSLAYLYTDHLPKTLMAVDLSYIRESAEWFSRQAYVDADGMGAVGLCFGGCMALHMACTVHKIKVVVDFNGVPIGCTPPNGNRLSTISHDGKEWPDSNRITHSAEGVIIKDIFYCKNPHFVPAWQHGAKILILVGEDDQQVDPQWQRRYKAAWPQKYRQNLEMVHYPGAGHLIEPPFSPLCRAVEPTRKRMQTVKFLPDSIHDSILLAGGSHKEHAFAQEDGWRRALKFLKEHLVDSASDIYKVNSDATS